VLICVLLLIATCRVRTNLSTDAELHVVHCRLTRYQSQSVERIHYTFPSSGLKCTNKITPTCYFPSIRTYITACPGYFPSVWRSQSLDRITRPIEYQGVMFVPTQHPIFTPSPDNRWCNYIVFCCLQVSGVSSAVWKECLKAPHPTKSRAQSKIFT